MKTLQDQYKLILEGKGNKDFFLKQAKRLYPNFFNQYTNFSTAVRVLKNKQILTEEQTAVEEFDPFKTMPNLYKYKDTKNRDNLNFNQILRGFYCEMGDIDNLSKTEDEILKIVTDKLAKDPLHYVKDGQFGLKGVGYTNTASGSLKIPEESKGKYKSSGMTELNENKYSLKKLLLEDSRSPFPDDWDSMEHPNYPTYHKGSKYGLFKSEEDGSWNDGGGNVNIAMIDSSDNIEDLIITAKEEYMNENNIEFDDIPLYKNGLPPGYHIDELNGDLNEAWEGAEFDTGKFDDGPQPPTYKVKILDIKKIQRVHEIIQDLGLGYVIKKRGYSDIFEFDNEEDFESVLYRLEQENIEYTIGDSHNNIKQPWD